MMKNKMSRATAAKIAKDLVEGGINTHHIVRLTAEGNNVTIEDVRKIKRFLMSKAADMICTYCEAIENGWEDERLNLEA